MPTRLSKFCEGVMEAAWLAALIVIPIFFNVYSSRIFEPDKISLLRTLALVTLGAWIVKLADEGGARREGLKSGLAGLLKIPLVLPVAALVVVYLVATLFSVSPSTSLWGSYQRLQGTYSTFSYLVIFAAILGNLRRRAQVERFITTAIIASLPVSLYGVLQRYGLDPIPWAGNVVTRIAANMGNPIFVAAYLIMVFPLTFMRIVDSFSAILEERGRLLPNFSRATAYVFIAALQLISLYFSGSRGPWLGWAASLIFLGLGLSLIWRKRWLTIAGVAAAGVAALFLILLNIPNGPLESLQSVPGIGRLGSLLDAESRTGQVRTLIWQGASELVSPHPPIEFPDGSQDRFNALRPLIGYGPESMYVAYNPFYPPELTLVEKRNASPDRSHNETWDSLVITGVLGLVVYLALFGSVLYYGLKWLRLVNGAGQRNLFLGLYLGGGLVSGVGFVAWGGLKFLGVGLPFGMILGVIIYLILTALFGRYQAPESNEEKVAAFVLLGLLAAIVAHFVEINFGIAIAATRTYFWAYAGLLVVVGYVLPRLGSQEERPASEWFAAPREAQAAATRHEKPRPAAVAAATAAAAKKKRHTTRTPVRSANPARPAWLSEALTTGLLVAVLLATLGYQFITSLQAGESALEILWNSFTRLRTNTAGLSAGVLIMLITTWLVAAVVMASESVQLNQGLDGLDLQWGRLLGTTLGIGLLGGLLYWLIHSGGLAAIAGATATNMDEMLRQVNRYQSLLGNYYLSLFALLFLAAVFLPAERPAETFGRTGMVLAPVALMVVVFAASFTNLRIIQADIAFKLADSFARPNTWPAAITIYNHANQLAPSEDYYYLFLGRAYIEYAKSLEKVEERDALIARAEEDLRKAQAINPLNTDHTANLARLYSLWAGLTEDIQLSDQRAEKSSQYFSRAVTLSPNSARLWDEWAYLYLLIIGDNDKAYEYLQQALEIDPYYDWTYGLLGDYYAQKAQFNDAIASYKKALELEAQGIDKWRIEETLARVYAQVGERNNALLHAQNALIAAPESQRDRLQALISQINGG